MPRSRFGGFGFGGGGTEVGIDLGGMMSAFGGGGLKAMKDFMASPKYREHVLLGVKQMLSGEDPLALFDAAQEILRLGPPDSKPEKVRDYVFGDAQAIINSRKVFEENRERQRQDTEIKGFMTEVEPRPAREITTQLPPVSEESRRLFGLGPLPERDDEEGDPNIMTEYSPPNVGRPRAYEMARLSPRDAWKDPKHIENIVSADEQAAERANRLDTAQSERNLRRLQEQEAERKRVRREQHAGVSASDLPQHLTGEDALLFGWKPDKPEKQPTALDIREQESKIDLNRSRIAGANALAEQRRRIPTMSGSQLVALRNSLVRQIQLVPDVEEEGRIKQQLAIVDDEIEKRTRQQSQGGAPAGSTKAGDISGSSASRTPKAKPTADSVMKKFGIPIR